LEHPLDALGVMGVHLAPEGGEVVAAHGFEGYPAGADGQASRPSTAAIVSGSKPRAARRLAVRAVSPAPLTSSAARRSSGGSAAKASSMRAGWRPWCWRSKRIAASP